MGYLPETMRNYLLRLGWSHGDDEIIPTAQAIEWFNFEAIGKSAARMDYKKLDNLNGHYIRETADDEPGRPNWRPSWNARRRRRSCRDRARDRLLAAMPALKERAKTLVELDQGAEFLYTDGVRGPGCGGGQAADAGGARPSWPGPCPRWKPPTGAAPPWKQAARDFAEQNGLKLGDVAQPLRAALTGKAYLAAPVRDVGTAGPGRIPYPIKGLCRLKKLACKRLRTW